MVVGVCAFVGMEDMRVQLGEQCRGDLTWPTFYPLAVDH